MMRPGLLVLLGVVIASAAGAEPVTVAVTPVQVGPHSWYVQGMSGEASAANQGFMSNAGFVITLDGVLYSGDLVFTGRVPFVGDADSKRWLAVIERLEKFNPKVLVPGHGRVSRDGRADLGLTRDYLVFLRDALKKPVEDLVPFDAAYRAIDWGRFAELPAFDAANRSNAYNTFLLLEKESLQR